MPVSPFANSSRQDAFARSGSSALLAASQRLAETIAGSAKDGDEDAARSLFETFKDSVELSNQVAKSVEQTRDSARSEKVSRIKQRIEQLKELLRFATPEQAKRMLRELKQISREFKAAAKELGAAGGQMAGQATAPVAAAAGGAPVSGDGSVQTAGTSAMASEQISVGTGLATAADSASGANNSPDSGTSEAAPGATGASQRDQNGALAEDDAQTQDGEPGWKEDLAVAIRSYTEQKGKAEESEKAARAAGLEDEKEALRKLARDIKLLARQLKAKAEEGKDKNERDDETDRSFDAISRNLQEAERELNRAGPAASAPPPPAETGSEAAAYSGSPVDLSGAFASFPVTLPTSEVIV